MPKNILVMSNKGGVGKTTVAVNLAISLSRRRYKTGLLDIDIHGPNAPKMLGIENEKFKTEKDKMLPVKKSNIFIVSPSFLLESESSPVIWRGPLKTKLINEFLYRVEWPLLDYLVVDLPPGTGDETITIMQLLKEDSAAALIVSTPGLISISDVKKAISTANNLEIPIIGIIENMSGEIFGSGTIKELAKEKGIAFLGSVALDKNIAESSNMGKPFILNPQIEPSKQFEKIVDKIVNNETIKSSEM